MRSRSSIAALVMVAALASEALAIPAFARRYGLPCSSCHDPFPRLTALGESFMANGYNLAPGDTTGTTSLGDSLLLVNQVFPLAVRFDAYARYAGGTGGRADLQAPYVVKLLSGGPIARNVSYYIYLLLAEDGRTGPVEDANVTFSQVLGAPLSLTVGQFQIIDPVWKRELRVTLEDYAMLRHRPASSAANLAYDRGLLATWTPSSRTTVFGEVVNGNGIGEAAAGSFDGDRPKTALLGASQALGPLRLSLIAYHGRQELSPAGGGGIVANRTRMAGPALQVEHGNFALGAQYLYRDDSDPAFSGSQTLTPARGGFAELSWWPHGRGSRLLLTGLYNAIETQAPAGDYETGTLNLTWLYARNLRLALEGTWDRVADRGSFSMGVVTAF